MRESGAARARDRGSEGGGFQLALEGALILLKYGGGWKSKGGESPSRDQIGLRLICRRGPRYNLCFLLPGQ